MSFLRPKFPRLFAFTATAGLAVVAGDLLLRPPGIARSGDRAGLTYGVLATLLMAGAALLSLRKSFKAAAGLGRTQSWLQFHVYGGGLGVLLALLHAGVSWPHGPLNWLLWLLTVWVGLSGLVGVLLQKWIPSLLASGLRLEVIFERIQEHAAGLVREADAIAQAASLPVQSFYSKELRPFMAELRPRLAFALDITGGFGKRLAVFEHVTSLLEGEDRARVEDLVVIAQEKNELDAHYTLQRLLRGWLVWHVAPSWLLLLLIAAHLFAVWVY
jgi:hypothetical protein